MVFLLTEQGWGDLAGDGEGGGHGCQRRQGEGWEAGSEASWQESGTGGRPPPLGAHRPGAAERYLSPEGETPGLGPPQSHHVRLPAGIQAKTPTLPFIYFQTLKWLRYSTET